MTDELTRAIEANPTRVVVVGGGVAGLVAARDLARPGFEVTVLEAAERAGGCVGSSEIGGVRLDTGAESFAVRCGHVAELLAELGLADRIQAPNPAGSWLQLPGRAVPSPRAGILGIPSVPLARDVIAAIGWRGATRAYLDRLMPVLKIGQERNLGTLVRRRMGRAVLENLVAPVTAGVYSAAPELLDTAVAAPGLNQALTRAGSLSGGVALLREDATPGAAVGGLEGGMSAFVDRLIEDATARGARIVTGTEVVALVPGEQGDAGERQQEDVARLGGGPADEPPARWRITTADGEHHPADAIVIALPQTAALAMLSDLPGLAEVADLEWPEPAPVDILSLVVDAPELDRAPRGTGVLVAGAAAGVAAKALTHSSAKWPWLAALLPPGTHALRLSYGRVGDDRARPATDAEWRDRALADATALLGIPVAASNLLGWARTSWRTAVPLAAHGQRERVDRVLRAAAELGAIEVTGGWIAGTGLASVVPNARGSAAKIRGLRWRQLTENGKESP